MLTIGLSIFLTLRTMTVLPAPPVINLAYGVSANSSDDGTPGGADVNGLHMFLPQESRHDLDL